jgi:hypothetical protein
VVEVGPSAHGKDLGFLSAALVSAMGLALGEVSLWALQSVQVHPSE